MRALLLRKRNLTLIFLALVILALTWGIIHKANGLFARVREIQDSYKFIDKLNETLIQARDGQKGFRNYIFTGEARYLNLFYSSFKDVRETLETLQMRVPVDHLEMHQEIEKLTNKIELAQSHLEKQLDRKKKSGAGSPEKYLGDKVDEKTFMEITEIIQGLCKSARWEIRDMEDQRAATRTSIIILVLLLFLTHLAFIACLIWIVWLDKKRQSRTHVLATQSEIRLQAIVDNIPARVFMKDMEGKYLMVNRQFERFYDLSKQAVIGKNTYQIFPREVAERYVDQDRKVMTTGETLTTEDVVSHESGLRVCSTVRFPLYGSGGVPYAVCGVVMDITEQMQAQEEIVKAKEEAERANKAKTVFLSAMSHELRTPLNSIIGFSEVLLRETEGPLGESQKEFTGLILDNGKHLLSLINDLLDLSKVEAGKMELYLEEADLKVFLENSVAMVQHTATQKHLRMELNIKEDVGTIRLDPRKIKQVLFNLLSNAIKFTPEEGLIRVDSDRLNENEVEVSVTDSGIGIERKDFHKVFQQFSQIDSDYARQLKGTGLGLALTKQLVEKHGGQIWFKSEGKNKGTTFTFTLPNDPGKKPIKRS